MTTSVSSGVGGWIGDGVGEEVGDGVGDETDVIDDSSGRCSRII